MTAEQDSSKTGCKSSRKEIYRKVPGDFYSPSIRIETDPELLGHGITICVGGLCITHPIEQWHGMAKDYGCIS